MSLYRTSNAALRSNLRPCVARAQIHTTSLRAVKFEGKDMDDLGGPGGQVPPPQNPGGPDAVKRNWVPIAAGVLAVGAGVWYMTSPGQEKIVSRAKELEQKGASKAQDLKNQAAVKAQDLEAKAKGLQGDTPKSMQELSGRKGGTGFRSE